MSRCLLACVFGLSLALCQGQGCSSAPVPNDGSGDTGQDDTSGDDQTGDDTAPDEPADDPAPANTKVRLETSMGDIVLELYDDEAPITTANFLQYVNDGFYDGTIFHRIMPEFVVQGGGFLPGFVPQEGLRDPIVNEFSEDRSNVRGTVAMAKVGGDPDSATSQFFINLVDNNDPSNPYNLDDQNGGFTVFAVVVEGMDVADAMAEVDLVNSVPVNDIVLISATVEDED